MQLQFSVGNSDFGSIISNGADYVDKTSLIAEVIADNMQVLLFPRPRRFGKTLNLSMLHYFFDIRKKAGSLFKNLTISQLPEFSHQGQYPTIFVSFKNIKFQNLSQAEAGLKTCFAELYEQHIDLLENKLSEPETAYFNQVRNKTTILVDLTAALSFLMQALCKHYQQKVVVLLDEYDTPIHAAYQYGYYSDMVNFMRALMGAAFKDNVNLYKGIITGILRVSKEGMFSGLNNITVHSILSNKYAKHFGFTQQEIDVLLEMVNRKDLREEIRRWYNGFQFGALEIYNPWSIINFFCFDYEFKPYWVGTSDNALVKQILAEGSSRLKSAFEELVIGKTILQEIDEFITLPELMMCEDVSFSLLLFSGYLKVISKQLYGTRYRCELKIPNEEIKCLLDDLLRHFFDTQHFSQNNYDALLQSLVKGEMKLFEKLLSQYLLECFSYFDVKQKEPERFFHGFVLGLLVSLQETHLVQSNKESGYGRYDVMIIPKDKTKLGTIIEFKVADDESEVSEAFIEAFAQIEAQQYVTQLKAQGVTNIQTLVIVFCGKKLKLEKR